MNAQVHFVLRCWAFISGPLGLKKEGSKEKIDEGLVQLKSLQCVALLSFWLTKLLLDKCNSHLLQMTFWTFDGDHVLHNSEKMLFIIAHKCLFHPALAAPSGDGGEERRLPQAIPARVPPTATITGWLEIPLSENCYCEEIWWGRKLIGSIKWIERLKMCLWEHCLSRCQYYDIYVIYTHQFWRARTLSW